MCWHNTEHLALFRGEPAEGFIEPLGDRPGPAPANGLAVDAGDSEDLGRRAAQQDLLGSIHLWYGKGLLAQRDSDTRVASLKR